MMQQLQAEIISIGTELLLGEIIDTNASWLAGQLPALGIPVYRINQVGDNQARLTATLREGWERANLLILTGGLGPTEDDVTREAIADLVEERMVVVPELEKALRAWFAGRGRPMPERNVKQVTVIPCAQILANPIGTAPGWWVEREGRIIATMPGVPVEMRRMWREQVLPRLLSLPRGGTITKRTLKILGVGESAVEEELGELIHSTNPTVATYAKDDGIHVRLAARAHDQDEALRLLADAETRIRALFGAHVYGIDDQSLASSTVQLLAAHGYQLGVVESGLGGLVCAALSTGAFAGGEILPLNLHAQPDDSQAEPESLGRIALSLAQRARAIPGASIGLGVTATPSTTGGTYLSVGVSGAPGEASRVEEHRTDPEDVPRRAVLQAIMLVRQLLLQS